MHYFPEWFHNCLGPGVSQDGLVSGGRSMRKWKKALASVAVASMLFAGQGGFDDVHGDEPAGSPGQVGGAIVGGVAGGLVGSQIGSGRGRIAAIIGGTLAGAALGSYVGGSMDRDDQRRASQALESHETGKTVQWRNPGSGHGYEMTPTRTYRASDGRYCREFTTRVTIGGKNEEAYGTACRMPDGSWQIIDEEAERVESQPPFRGDGRAVVIVPGRTVYCPASVKIPPGHLPPPGLCRVWHQGTPPGHQPPPGDCAALSRGVPPGACLVTR
jgi:surface antigen